MKWFRKARPWIGLVMTVAGIVAFFMARSGTARAGQEIALQGSDAPGPSVFTPSVAMAAPAPATAPATSSPPAGAGGTTAGLFEASRNTASCNVPQLTTFLEGTPEKARAWAAAAGVAPSDVNAYLNTLTPAITRVDTRVTDFGLREGKAVPRQVVLQAGTSVLLDRSAFPRVRCSSGNPLAEPRALPAKPRYTGPPWPAFQPANVVVIPSIPQPPVIMLVDRISGAVFGRLMSGAGVIDIDPPAPGAPLVVVEPGQQGTVAGSNWAPGTPLQITFDNPAVALGAANADAAGSFSLLVTVPPQAEPGVHLVTISGAGSSVNQTIYVIPRAVRVNRAGGLG
jgi:hypothetical protein